MRFRPSPEVQRLREEVEPYLHGSKPRDDAPEEIKRKYEEWSRRYGEESDAMDKLNNT